MPLCPSRARPRLGSVPRRLDCDLPLLLADKLHRGDDPRPDFHMGWRSSDRPPLQTGLFLMQAWAWERGHLVPGGPYLPDGWFHYRLFGCAAQCAWVPAVWALGRLCRLPRRRCGVVVLFVAFSGFTLVNTVYCWPKLLAAALLVFVLVALIFFIQRRPRGLFPQKGRSAEN